MRGHLKKRSKHSWTIVLDLGYDDAGRRIQKWHTVQGTRQVAETRLTELLEQVNTGTYVPSSRITVGEYLDRWLEDYARSNVSAKTFERYAEVITLHIKPALGHIRLGKLQPSQIQSTYTEALKSGRKDHREGGLSAQTVLHQHRILHQALKQAVRWQLLVRNPADAVEPPRPKRKEMLALNASQTARLITLTRATALHVPVLLAVTTGLRRGEVLALRWKDIDLKAGALMVTRSLEQTKGCLAFREPKTATSRRRVSLPALTVEALKVHRVEQAKQRLMLGPAYQDGDLVCARPDGNPIDPRSLSHSFGKLIEKSDLPRVRFHDLRHTQATQLLTSGVHPKVVSERLGHSTVSITLDLYSHVLPGLQEQAAMEIDSQLRAALGAVDQNSR